jgi:DNA-directed RNA polymerase subunit M/transcription elongation factor TFIIS
MLALLPVDTAVPQPHVVTAALRPACLELLADGARTAAQRGYAAEVERQLFGRWRCDRPRYMARVRRLAFALRANRGRLMARLEPSALLEADHLVLGKDTEVCRWHQDYLRRQEQERELYSGDIPDTGGGPEDDVEGVVRCSRCKSSDIRWDQKQTRGADESMTVFFECKNCSKRWKMS